MSRYELVVPPVRSWPRLWLANYRRLLVLTLGRTWQQMNSLRNDPPV